MPQYIVSQPAIALCIESRSSRSPATTSAPISRNACARSSSFRTIARTALPCFKSSSARVRPAAPTRPAAPVTRMGFAIFYPLCVYLDRKPAGRFSSRRPSSDDYDAVSRSLRQLSAGLLRRHVRGVPVRPVLVAPAAGALLMLAVSGLRTTKRACQVVRRREGRRRRVEAAGHPRRDFLEQPAVAVGITKRGE